MRSLLRGTVLSVMGVLFLTPFALGEVIATTTAEALAARRAESVVFREAARKIRPGIVKIIADSTRLPSAVRRTPRSDAAPKPEEIEPDLVYTIAEGPSTGLIYRQDGLILTSSFHFVRVPSKITVHLADGRSFPAELLARDQVRKLAMLKIDATNLPAARWSDRAHVKPGMWAIALGWGFAGKQPAPSVGIVSAVDRMGGDIVQVDANLSPANYGGPVIDVTGGVIGIAVPMGTRPGQTAGVDFYDAGIGFVVGRWSLDQVASALASGRNIYRGFLGIQIRDTDKVGAYVFKTADPSPARAAGLTSGDRVIQIDDHPLAQVHTLLRHMSYRAAGESVRLVVQRGDETFEKHITLVPEKDLGLIGNE